ncbi:MAG: response regulator [Candidatus Rifleibacteriota bacterium]
MKSILIIDDEKNIRLTLTRVFDDGNFKLSTAVNGEEALQKMTEEEFSLVLLDLNLPGMSGMSVLKQITQNFPCTRTVIITAHGSVESAVEAMKLGAVDFLQKPFSPGEIRDLVGKILNRENLDEKNATDYSAILELTKKFLNQCRFESALETIRRAVAIDPNKPEAFNLMGAILEVKGKRLESQKFYRTALEIDPTYKPARDNLNRVTLSNADSDISFGS